MLKIKSEAFSWWKSIHPILWALAAIVIPQMISDLSSVAPHSLWTKWALTSVILLLKMALDKVSHTGNTSTTPPN